MEMGKNGADASYTASGEREMFHRGARSDGENAAVASVRLGLQV